MRLARLCKAAPLLVLGLSLYGCPQRQEIKAHFWNQSGLPKAICALPGAAKSGVYRRLNDDQCNGVPAPCYQFVSYCDPNIVHYLPILDTELNDLLDKYTEKK